jgi:hypothetical protein
MTDDDLLANLVKLRRPILRPRVKVGFPQQMAAPASEDDLVRTEQLLGFAIPPLLRRLYKEVANGGFGPGYGLTGAEGGKADAIGYSIGGAYRLRREIDPSASSWRWPEHLVPLVSWGEGAFSCGDFSKPGCPLYVFDPLRWPEGTESLGALPIHAPGLREFLSDWIRGEEVLPPEH